jgi:hypothetical protein
MCDAFMPRANRAFRIDDRLLEALDRLAKKGNISANKYLENLLMSHAKQVGEIPMDAEPLGDPRGGKRLGSGRPKASPPTNTTMSPEELEAAAQSLGEAFSGSVVDLEEFERTMADRDGSEGGAIDG